MIFYTLYIVSQNIAFFMESLVLRASPFGSSKIERMQYTGAPVVGTPILGTHYIVSFDAEVCGAERESSRTIQGRMH